MLIHLPRGNKLTPTNNARLYALNQLIQHIGKQEGTKRTKSMGKKTREQIVKLVNQYLNLKKGTIVARNCAKNKNKYKNTKKRVKKGLKH